jgi:hypothetical protein
MLLGAVVTAKRPPSWASDTKQIPADARCVKKEGREKGELTKEVHCQPYCAVQGEVYVGIRVSFGKKVKRTYNDNERTNEIPI